MLLDPTIPTFLIDLAVWEPRGGITETGFRIRIFRVDVKDFVASKLIAIIQFWVAEIHL